MQFLLSLLGYVSFVCAVIGLWKPRLYPLKRPTRGKAFAFYFAIGVILLILSGSAVNDAEQGAYQSSTETRQSSKIQGGVLAWEEVSREQQPMPGTRRDRVRLVIVPKEEQELAIQSDIIATAKGVAIKVQRETLAPVVVVDMVCQNTGNALADLLLAHVVYIPDGKGFDGTEDEVPVWESLRAAMRGFTPMELEYLRSWADTHRQYQSATGLLAGRLDEAISRKLSISPGSLNPFANVLQEEKKADNGLMR